MAYVSYTTPTDIEGLTYAPAPSNSISSKLYLAAAVAVGCGLVLLSQAAGAPAAAQELRVVPRPVSSVAPGAPLAQVRSDVVAQKPAGASLMQKVGTGLAALSLSTMANMAPVQPVMASELSILGEPTPTAEYVYDDGAFLSKSGTDSLKALLPDIEARTGYRINVVTMRKLVQSDDPFQFADSVIENWYPTAELGDKKAVFVLVKNSKEAGLVGGPAFSSAIPTDMIQSIIDDNIGTLAGEEKYNAAVISTVKRLDAVLSGKPDPGPPRMSIIKAKEAKAKADSAANYKDKSETDSKRGVYGVAVGGLLIISVVAPMVQYFSFTKK